MRILKVFFDQYPWDIRVEKVCRALLDAGHDIHLVCRNRGSSARQETATAGLRISRVPSGPVNGWVLRIMGFPVWFSPVWARALRRMLANDRPDAVLVRDLPLAPLAVDASHRAGVPCVLDMAEDYPAMLAAYRPWQSPLRRAMNLAVRNVTVARALERRVLSGCDVVLVVAEEQRSRLLAMGVDPARVVLVGNTPERECVMTWRRTSRPVGGAANGVADILYVGEVHEYRGLDTAILAMPQVTRRWQEARLVIVGTGEGTRRLSRLANRIGMRSHVRFQGWVDHARIGSVIGAAEVCLVPHRSSAHTATTLPNKLFDYLGLGRPIVTSDVAPIRRIIEQWDCGLVFHAGDAHDLARALLRLRDPAERARLGARAALAAEHYLWDDDRQRLLDAFALLSSVRRRRES